MHIATSTPRDILRPYLPVKFLMLSIALPNALFLLSINLFQKVFILRAKIWKNPVRYSQLTGFYEIFAENNFIATIIWEKAYAPVNLKKHFSESHDYILCYAKDKTKAVCNGLART